MVALLGLAYFNPIFRGYSFSNVGAYETVLYPWAGVVPSLNRAFYPQSDYPEGGYPTLQLMHQALRAGHVPTWSSANFAGVPVLGGFFYGTVFYPVRFVTTYLFAPDWSHDVYVTFHVVVAGVAFHLLARRLGASRVASVIGGVSWMLAPAWFAFSPFEAPAVLGAWLPLMLLAADSLARRVTPARVGAFGLVSGMGILALQVQYGLYLVALGVLWTLLAADGPMVGTAGLRGHGRRLLGVIGGSVVGFAIAGPILLVTMKLLDGSNRTALPLSYVKSVAAMGRYQWISFPWTNVSSPPIPANVWTSTYLGLAGGVLLVVGAVFARGRVWRASLALVVLGVLVLSGTPATLLAYHLMPGFSSIDPLGRLLPMVVGPALLLAVLGFDVIATRLAGSLGRLPRRRLVLAAPLALGLLVVATQYWQLATLDRSLTPGFEPRKAIYRFPATPAIQAIHDAAPVGGGRQQRLGAVATATGIVMVADEPNLFGIDSLGGYENVVPKRTVALMRFAAGEPAAASVAKLTGSYRGALVAETARWSLLPRLGVTTFFTPPQYAANAAMTKGLAATNARLTYAGPDGAVFSVPSATPRAFVVGSSIVAGGSRALDLLASPGFDPSTSVILERRSRGAPAAGRTTGSVTIAPIDGNRRRFTVDADRAGYLVMLDSYADGWTARVNGRTTPVEPADTAFRAVLVPAGRSVVTLAYTPPGLRTGLLLSLLGLVAAGGLLLAPGLTPRLRRMSRRQP